MSPRRGSNGREGERVSIKMPLLRSLEFGHLEINCCREEGKIRYRNERLEFLDQSGSGVSPLNLNPRESGETPLPL